jgi:alpha-beta hydrolase superfamily lysophospholipase
VRRGGRRAALARLERPLLAGGLALLTLHLLDLAISGPDTAVLGVVGIVAVPAAWLALQPRLVRPTRFALALLVGLLAFGFGVVSHGLHVVNSGPDWRDLTGVGMIAGGLALVVAAAAALAAPRRRPRREAPAWRVAHGAGWLAGAAVFLAYLVPSLVEVQMVTHAPRWAIQESSLRIPHEEVAVPTADGRELSAWYVPSRNRTAVLLDHGSGGSRERVAEHVEMLARHGYGVLALDLPGNGESEGHSNGLGDNAQPAVDAGLAYLARRDDVDRDRIAGYGISLGAEVLIEAASRDTRLRAVVADGATRPQDAEDAGDPPLYERPRLWLMLQAIRGVSGMRTSTSLNPMMERIAPRPVLLVAAGGFPQEIAANRTYQRHGGPTTELYELPEAGHTGGLRARPEEYERRTTAFLDRALGL